MVDIAGVQFYFKAASPTSGFQSGFTDAQIDFLIGELETAILADSASRTFFRSLQGRKIYLFIGNEDGAFGAEYGTGGFASTDKFKSNSSDSDPQSVSSGVEILKVGQNLVESAGAASVHTPTNTTFQEAVSQELFHELAHAATNPLLIYQGVFHSSTVFTEENIAVAAEGLIYAPAHGTQVRVGHGAPNGQSIDPTIAFRGLGSVAYTLVKNFDGGVSAGRFRVQSGSATLSKWYVGQKFDVGIYSQGKHSGDRKLDNETILGLVQAQPVISSSGAPSAMLSRLLSGSLTTKGTVGALAQVAKTESFLTGLSTAIHNVSGNSAIASRLSAALAAPDLNSVIRALGTSNELSVADRPQIGPVDDATGASAASLYLHGLADGTLLIGGSGDVDTVHQIKTSNVTDTLVAGSGTATNVLVAGTGHSASSGVRNELIGNKGADYLIGQQGDDNLSGGAGDDVLIKSGGKDWLDGGSGINTIVLPQNSKLNEVVDMRSMATKGYGTITDSTGTSQVRNVQVIVGGAGKTTFYGNGHNVFIAGSGGAIFHLQSGDVAIANPASKVGNAYYVTSNDINKNHIGIVGLGKNDKLYVDGKLFNGSTALATTLGESHDSNADGPGNAGVFTRASSSWGTSLTQPRLYDTYDQPPEAGLRYHYWINGTDLNNPSPLNLKDVTYVKSADQSGTPGGDIYFTSQSGDGFGNTTVSAALDISVIGWQQGYAGINFHENNLARDTLGALSIGYGIGGWQGQVLGGVGVAGAAGAAVNPGFYMLGDVLTAVGGLFDPSSSEWQSADPGQLSAWDQIDQLISAIEDDTVDGADLPDQNPFGPGDDGDGGGGIGPIGNMPGDGGSPSIAVLEGDASANVLDTAGGYGKINGGGGGDTIIYDLGYGSIIIDEQDTAATPANVLQFGAGIAPADVAIDATPEGDIVLTVGEDASITITGALVSTADLTKGVQQVTFADGTSWSYADMLAALETATADRSAIYGDSGANVLDVDGVVSSAVGGGGGDTFVFAAGYGAVTIDERDISGNASNTLTFGAGIDPWSATVTADSDGSITIDFGDGDQVSIANALLSDADATYGVQQISFADGTTWSYADLLASADTASSSNRALYGDRSANYLWGGGIASSLTGGGGGDTFVFDRGDAPITIYESDSAPTPTDQLTINGFDPGEFSVSANAAGDLLLHADGVVQVTIAGGLNSDGQIARGVQSVVFGDGTIWTYSDLVAKADTASSDNLELFGDDQANLFDPQGLATSVVGGGGGDTIMYQRGYGALSIVEADASATPANVLAFGTDVVAADITVSGNATGDLVLSLGSGDTVTLVGALISAAGIINGVQTISFADGTSWTYADLLQKALAATSGGTIIGDTSANIIDSGAIAGVAIGNGGNDTFLYDAGYGALTIDEEDGAVSANNILTLGSGISANTATVSATADDIVLSFGGSDTITLAKALQSDGATAFGVQAVQFADGTSWSYADLLAKLATPTSGGTIFGDRSANVLDTAGLANVIVGGGGGDTIIFNQGDGNVTVTETDSSGRPDNILLIGVGIDPSEVTVTGTTAGSIVIDAGNGDSISFNNALRNSNDATYGIQQVRFQDGTIWSYDDLLTKIDTPSVTNTTLYGDSGANTLDGAGIATLVVGNGGDDTFAYQRGYGALTIDEQDAGGLPDNRLVLGAGILTVDVSVSANANGDLVLSMASGDVITLKNALASDQDIAFGVQEVAFDDGTVWSYTDLVDLAVIPSSTKTTLYGDGYANTFDSAGVAYQIVGGGGGDDFFYARGYGALSIDERDGGDTPSNSLSFAPGIAPDDVTVSVSSVGDILLSLGSGDVVTLTAANTATPGLSVGVQEVKFDGGLSWNAAQIHALALGAWTIADDGRATEIDEATNFGASTPVIHLAFASTDTTVALSEDRQSLILTSANNTVVAIEDLLRLGAGAGQIIDFSDGVSWSLDHAMSQATSAADVVNYEVGTSAAESFNFGGSIREVIGFGGGDQIRYDIGDGFVTVDEADSSASSENVLNFGSGIGLSDLTITSDGHDLYLKLLDGDEVVVASALASDATTTYGVQRVTFEDGSSTSYAELLAIADTGSIDNNGTLYGDANANVIDPAGFSHAVIGRGGNDTIVYNLGYGDLAIIDQEQATGANSSIAFGAGIAPSDIQIVPNIANPEYASGELDILVAGSTISIEQELNSSTPIIGSLSFADGTVLDYADILAGLATPYAGKPAIAGDRGANTLDTQGLTHEAIGNGGGDTFVYNLGYGALNIEEYDRAQAPANRLLFGSGILPGDVAVSISYNGVATLQLSATDSVNFKTNLFDPSAGVQSIEFADGTIWNSSQLLDISNQGSPGKTEILGHDFSETFDSRGYASYIAGRGGSDTYIFKSGYGALTINDLGYGPDTDTLQIGAGINPADVIISKVGQDLVLSIGASDRVVVQYQFANSYPTYKPGIERVTFADGTIWSAADITSQALAVPTGSAAEVDTQSVVSGDFTLPATTNSNLTTTGTIGFTDVDTGDRHSASVVGVTYSDSLLSTLPSTFTMLSYLSASVGSEPDVGAAGAINWSFAAPSSAFNNLSPGESVDLVFAVQIKDHNNAVVTQNVTVTVAAGLDGNAGTSFISGTSGDDALYVDRNEIVTPGAGNDTVYTSGYGGTVTHFSKGDGQDHLINNSYYTVRSDALILTDTLADEVSVTRSGAAITLNVDATGDSFTADNQLFGSSTGLERVQFADGVSWSRSELFNRTAGTVTAIESAGAILDATSDTDTFTVGSGIGDAVVNDFDATGAHHDYLLLNRSQFSDWAHLLGATRQQGSDLVIDIDSTNSLTLAGVSLASFSQQNVKFAGMPA